MTRLAMNARLGNLTGEIDTLWRNPSFIEAGDYTQIMDTPTDPEILPEALEARRTLAIERLKRKRDFLALAVIYGMANLLLILIWLIATAHNNFWPAWTLIGGAILLGYAGWQIYMVKPISEREITDELRRIS